MKYRAEIDGLRALAVVPVILFHAGFELFSGGFVGVDVFFVISGYLITTILIEDIENKRFSIVNFYERRARRILPALFFVMLVCIPFAWMLMLPSQMKDFLQSLVAVSLFASNILFWRESGYFDAAAEEKPLLHTWSLAVEEQYYVLFPIFLILAWRFGKNRVFWMIVVMAAISLLLSEWGWRNEATANFYLAPTRAWELFAGSIAAFIVQKQGVQKNNLLAALGLAAIIFAIYFYDETTPFPSMYALVPVLGVVLLVLYADKETLAAKLLSTKGFVGIGLISYSAYLWHQPLFAFSRIESVSEPSLLLMVMLALSSLFLAYLSWRYIETPFRNKQAIGRGKIFIVSLVGLIFFVSFSFLGHMTNGFLTRFPGASSYEQFLEAKKPSSGCILGFEESSIKPCYFGSDNSRIDILAVGDSHINQWADVLKEAAYEKSLTITLVAKSACAIPVTSYVYSRLGRQYYECDEWRSKVIEFINDNKPATLLIQNSSVGYVSFNGVSLEQWELGIKSFIQAIDENINIVWILDNPRFPRESVLCVNNAILADSSDEVCATSRGKAIDENLQALERRVLKSLGVRIIDFTDAFCDENYCFTYRDGEAVMADGNHISQTFVEKLKPKFFTQLYHE